MSMANVEPTGIAGQMRCNTFAVGPPAAGLAEMARQAGARVAVVNPEPTAVDRFADWVLRGSSGELLPRFL